MNNKKPRAIVSEVANRMGAWLLIIVIALIMTFASDKFMTVSNLLNVVRQVCVTAIAALGVSFIVLGGEIDLSSGMGATFAGCNAAIFMTRFNMPVPLAILLAIIIGVCIGTFSGIIVTLWKIPSFIGTLGVQYIVEGLILVTTNSMPITGLPDSFLVLGRGYIADTIPVPVIIMLIYYIVGAFILKYTTFGRSVMAVGENVEAATLSGLKVKFTKIFMFALGGFCFASAGIVMTSRLSSGQPSSGSDLSLEALAAVYIGGTFSGSMWNTLSGALTWGFINNSLNLLGVSAYWQKVVLGAIIIIAVLMDTFRAKLAVSK